MLTAEFAVSFIVDFYRPRTIEEPRPIFESAILSLFTEPGGVMRNIADTLDYQFGFKVSGTYIYTFIERALFPAITIWLVVLWLFTSIDQIGPNQRGFRIRNGSLVSTDPLPPGTYLKLPWPFEHFLRYDCTEIHQIVIGNVHDHGNEEEEYVDDGHGHTPPPSQAEKDAMEATIKHLAYWDMHSDDDGSSYMVAVTTDGVQDTSGLPTNIAFVNVTFPIQYQIRESELLQYAFSNNNPGKTLEMIAESAATEYLASANLMGVLAYDRQKIASAIQEKIQQQADEMGLGVDIVNVVMIDVHPAAKVVPAYQQVISAQEEMRTKCPEEYFTLVMRRFMMRIADILADENSCKAIVTGENLGQVASQTMEAMAVTRAVTQKPILQPLVGMDKEEIVRHARNIGTFETSILPYEDCCTVFTPRHPRTKPRLKDVEAAESALDIDSLVREAVEGVERIWIDLEG